MELDVVSDWRGRPQSSVYPSGFTREAQSRHWLSLQVEIPLSPSQKKCSVFCPTKFILHTECPHLAENSVPMLPAARSLFRFFFSSSANSLRGRIQHCEIWNIATIKSRSSFQEYVTAFFFFFFPAQSPKFQLYNLQVWPTRTQKTLLCFNLLSIK